MKPRHQAVKGSGGVEAGRDGKGFWLILLSVQGFDQPGPCPVRLCAGKALPRVFQKTRCQASRYLPGWKLVLLPHGEHFPPFSVISLLQIFPRRSEISLLELAVYSIALSAFLMGVLKGRSPEGNEVIFLKVFIGV